MRKIISVALLLLIATVVVILIKYKDGVTWLELNQCPHYWSAVKDTGAHSRSNIFGDTLQNALAGELIDIPEYHDCQQLIIAGRASPVRVDTTPKPPRGTPLEQSGARSDRQSASPAISKAESFVKSSVLDPTIPANYGPLAAVFASPRLDRLEQDLNLSTPVVVDPRAPAPPKSANDVFMAAAQIINVDTMSYFPLRLDKGLSFYCIYLSSQGVRWEAQMIKAESCRLKSTRVELHNKGALPMTVTTLQRGSLAHAAYPGVVRFHWDGAGQAVGAKCGAAWCVMSFNPNPTFEPLYDGTPTVSVPGWYDEQRLGVMDATNKLKLSNTIGRIVPDSALDGRRIAEFWRGWVPTARVYISSNEYKAKLNFTETLTPGTANEIYMRLVEKNAPGSYPRDCTPEDINPPPSTAEIDRNGKWETKVISATGNCRIFKTERMPHGTAPTTYKGRPVKVIGTARWRFIDHDETVWVECDNGCCQVIG